MLAGRAVQPPELDARPPPRRLNSSQDCLHERGFDERGFDERGFDEQAFAQNRSVP
jgi:hypothetical protein